MSARERLVQEVFNALIDHQRIPMFDGTGGERCVGCDDLRGEPDGSNSPRHTQHLAEAVVAALEERMGLQVNHSHTYIVGGGCSHPTKHRMMIDWMVEEDE